jgi:methionyl-tRNA synthetase
LETRDSGPAGKNGEIRVGRVVEVRDHPDADKLFAMTVDLGGERRSICAGLRPYLRAEDLAGRKVAVLANLKPALLRGIESHSMILATDRKDGKVAPVDPGEAKAGELVTVEGVPSEPKAKLSRSDFDHVSLVTQAGRVTCRGTALRSDHCELLCDAEDGARVR